MSDLADLPLTVAADRVAKGETTAAALLEAVLARMDAVNPVLNVRIWEDRERARAASRARLATREAARIVAWTRGGFAAAADQIFGQVAFARCSAPGEFPTTCRETDN